MIKELEFKGKTFKIEYVETYATHPTWYSFEDEKDVREAFWNPKEGDVVLDVGACCGSYTLPALAHGAKVWAWAPGKLMEGTSEGEILKRNAELNGWGQANCFVLEDWGLYDQLGYLDVGKQTLRPIDFKVPLQENEIRVQPLDRFFGPNVLQRLDWIKIDVEGAELNVLRGGRDLIKKDHPKILVECHLFVRATMGIEVTDFLMDEIGGYKLEKLPIKHPASDVIHCLFEPL